MTGGAGDPSGGATSKGGDFDRLTGDRLTGVAGYHYFRLRLDEELRRAARYRRPLGLVLVDVDDLRGLNDRFGRAAGDAALQQVAAALAGTSRQVDRIGRWSGGAFAILVPETGAAEAFALAERLRAEVATRRFLLPTKLTAQPLALRLTVSCGVAALPAEAAPGAVATLPARADHALWRAKRGGRNRAVLD